MRSEKIDFLEWLHAEREEMEEERKKQSLTVREWANRQLDPLKKRGLIIWEREEVVQ